MDKNVQQAMLPGSVAWFIQKKPFRILNIVMVVLFAVFLVFIVLAVIDDSIFDELTGVHALFILVFVLAMLTVAILVIKRSYHDQAVYIKENGYIFKVMPTPNSGSGAMYGGMAGGLIGAAIGAAIDAATTDNSAAVGSGVLGMVHTRIGMVHQVTGILQIEDKGDEYIVTATMIQHQKNGKTTKPKQQKLRINKTFLAVDSLMAELNAMQLH